MFNYIILPVLSLLFFIRVRLDLPMLYYRSRNAYFGASGAAILVITTLKAPPTATIFALSFIGRGEGENRIYAIYLCKA